MGRIAIVGASSPVGLRIVARLRVMGADVVAFSRKALQDNETPGLWRKLPTADQPSTLLNPDNSAIERWIFVAHIWVVSEHFEMLKAYGAKRVLAVSSTSRFTKVDSRDRAERELTARLSTAEDVFINWCSDNGVAWTVLRPTMIYGGGADRNISAISSFAKRFKFFPIVGQAGGLRQPIHADDVASACIAAIEAESTENKAYNISGGEILSYRKMVGRVFEQLGQRPNLLVIPPFIVKSGISGARLLPRYRHWSPAMADRMNKDMVFDHTDAKRDFGFSPRSFILTDAEVLNSSSSKR